MKLRQPESITVLSRISTPGFSLVPAMPQNTPNTSSPGVARQADDTASIVKDNWNPIVDTSILPESLLAPAATGFPDVTENSTPTAAPRRAAASLESKISGAE